MESNVNNLNGVPNFGHGFEKEKEPEMKEVAEIVEEEKEVKMGKGKKSSK